MLHALLSVCNRSAAARAYSAASYLQLPHYILVPTLAARPALPCHTASYRRALPLTGAAALPCPQQVLLRCCDPFVDPLAGKAWGKLDAR